MKPEELEQIVEPKKDRYLEPGASFQRLRTEYQKHGCLHIAYDFDGTIHDFHAVGDTYPRVIKLLKKLKEINCKLYCWTAYPDMEHVKQYLQDNSIPCDGINCDGIKLPWESRKPFYSAILDDRAGLRDVVRDLELLVLNIEMENLQSDSQYDGLV